MKLLEVAGHLAADEVFRRYRVCPDARAKTRWHAIWLMVRPDGALSAEKAAEPVGLSNVWLRKLVHRHNAKGPDGDWLYPDALRLKDGVELPRDLRVAVPEQMRGPPAGLVEVERQVARLLRHPRRVGVSRPSGDEHFPRPDVEEEQRGQLNHTAHRPGSDGEGLHQPLIAGEGRRGRLRSRPPESGRPSPATRPCPVRLLVAREGR